VPETFHAMTSCVLAFLLISAANCLSFPSMVNSEAPSVLARVCKAVKLPEF